MSSHVKPCSSYPPPPLTASKSYLITKVNEILHTNDLTEFTKLISKLCYGKETEDSSKHLYDSFKHHFPNLIAVNLLRVYTSINNNAKVRSHSLSLLHSLLIDLEDHRLFLKKVTVESIKTRLNTCLLLQETSVNDFKLLSRIISILAVDVFIEHDMHWDELCSYIISLQDNKRMLLLFSELPTVLDDDFLMPLLGENLYGKIRKGLVDPDSDEEWCLAFEAGFNLMLHLINVPGNHMMKDMEYTLVDSVWKMVNVRKKEVVVRRGLIRLARIVRREVGRFRENEHDLVSRIGSSMKMINGVKKETEMAAEKILEVLKGNFMEGKALDWGFIHKHLALH